MNLEELPGSDEYMPVTNALDFTPQTTGVGRVSSAARCQAVESLRQPVQRSMDSYRNSYRNAAILKNAPLGQYGTRFAQKPNNATHKPSGSDARLLDRTVRPRRDFIEKII